MAVHLNARLNTRFIPILFTGAALLAVASISSRASPGADRRPGFSGITYAPDRTDSGSPDIASQLPLSSNAEGPAPIEASPSNSGPDSE